MKNEKIKISLKDEWDTIINETEVEIETLAEIDSMFEVWTAIIEYCPHLRHKLDEYENLMLRICKRDWGEETEADFDRSALTICAKLHGVERRWSLPNKSILADKNAPPFDLNGNGAPVGT
jgi:hypothetical protein